MRLGTLFLTWRVDKIPYRFRGKNRKVKKPTLQDLYRMKWDFLREERNMMILRHPYLTPEQSHGHMIEIKKNNSFIMDKFRADRDNNFSKQIKIVDRLNHLNVKKVWD